MNSETSGVKEKSLEFVIRKQKLQLAPWDLTCLCILDHVGGKPFCIYRAGKELFIIVVLIALVNFILDDQSNSLQHLVEH